MSPERLLKHFEQISEAPNAVPRLRRFILDLAVRGKLVEQNATDEPALELLKRIEIEKLRLTHADNLRSQKVLPLDEALIPFSIPSNWAWAQLAQIGIINPRNNANDSTEASFTPMPMIFAEFGREHQHEVRPWGEIKKGFTHFAEGDVGLAKITPCFENGKSAVFRNLTCGLGAGTTELHIVRPIFVVADYVLIFLKSPHFIETGISKMTGTAGQKRVSKDYFAFTPFPLPPLAEQERIVARVNELMALCAKLEAAKSKREKRRDRLVAATLHGLSNGDASPAPGARPTFKGSARFYLNHLPRLTTRPEHIHQLRQTILNLAIRGKLVPQDPNDEPASTLLRKKMSLPSGYQRRRKILKNSPVYAPEGLFPAIPESWEYTDIQTLYELNVVIDYGDGNHGSLYPRSSEFGATGVTFVTAKDLVGGRVDWDGCAKLGQRRANQLTKGWAAGSDVLLTHNATVGRIARVEPEVGRFLLGTSVTFYRLNLDVLSADFFYYILMSQLWQGQLQAIMEQTTRNQVSIQKQAFFRVVVPPIAEQHRIVVKVDELMALCNKLEGRLTSHIAARYQLLQSVLQEALGGRV